MSFVRGVIARAERVGVERQYEGARSVTTLRVRAGDRDARGVRVVVRLERDDLVARFAQREQRRRDRFGRAGGHEHFGVGVVLERRRSGAGDRAIASRSAGTPMPGGYWLWPASIASIAARFTASGPSVSGNP